MSENNNNLNDEYEFLFEEITEYLESCPIPDKNCNEIIEDIYNYLVMAQQDGKSAQEAVGENLKTFCNEVIAESLESKGSKTRVLFKNIYYLSLILSALATIDFITSVVIEKIIINKDFSFSYNITLNKVIILIELLFCVYFVLTNIYRTAFKDNKKNIIKSIILYFFIFVLLLISVSITSLLNLSKIIILSTNGFILLFILYILSYFLKLLSSKL